MKYILSTFHHYGAVKLAGMSMLVLSYILALDSQSINSLALLGVAIITLWTARKTATIAPQVATTAKTVEAVHTLSNSAMGAQLQSAVDDAKALAVLFHVLADKDHNDTSAAAAAVAADVKVQQRQLLLSQHLVQQAKVDAAAAAVKGAE